MYPTDANALNTPLMARFRLKIRKHLLRRLHLFEMMYGHQMPEAQRTRLLEAMQLRDVVGANRALHACIAAVHAEKADAWPFWDIIDATSAWEDTVPGRWPYFTPLNALHSFKWALEDARKAVALRLL